MLATTAALPVAAGDLIPVDHVPPGVKVLGAAVLILEIVGVLPNIVAHDRVQTVHKWAVLVGSGDDLEFAILVEHEPRPSRAEALNASIV